MDPKAVLQIVQHELQQLIQDLLGIDGDAQSGKDAGLHSTRDQGSHIWCASKGRQDEDEGSKPTIPSQGYEKCIQYRAWKMSDAKMATTTIPRAPPIVVSTKLYKLKNSWVTSQDFKWIVFGI